MKKGESYIFGMFTIMKCILTYLLSWETTPKWTVNTWGEYVYFFTYVHFIERKLTSFTPTYVLHSFFIRRWWIVVWLGVCFLLAIACFW